MSDKIKKLKDDMTESVYQIGEGENQLRLRVSVSQAEYRTREGNNPDEHHFGSAKTDCVELRLSSGDKDIYKIKQKGHEDAHIESGDGKDSYAGSWYAAEKKVDIRKEIAEKLYKDNSDGACAVKGILQQIKGHPLFEAIKQNMADIHAREVKQAHERELQELNNSKLAKIRKKAAKLADKVTEKLGLENVVQRFTDGKRIEDVEINSKARVMEKKFSDKWLGKVKE